MNYKNLEFNVVKIIVTFVREMEMFYSQKDSFYLPKENLGHERQFSLKINLGKFS